MRGKRLLCAGLGMLLALSACLAGCGNSSGGTEAFMVLAEQDTYENNHFIQSAWAGVEGYCTQHDIPCEWMESEHRHYEAQEEAVGYAVGQGAEVVVLPGYLLEPTALIVQDEFPDVHFILVDGVPNNGDYDNYVEHVADNTLPLTYAEEQAGYLAGYAAVMDGFTRLGFFGGMQVPTVTRFGYGYLQGAERAAQELGMEEESIEVRYLYCGAFTPSPEFQAKASTWYYDGTEIIFACGGGMGLSVIAAAESAEDAWVIGVDVDQSTDSERILTSAVKNVEGSVYNAVRSHFEGTFEGGQALRLTAADDGVGLPMETSRFREFTQQQYDTIFEALATDEGGIASGILKDDVPMDELPLSCVRVEMDAVN